LFSSSKESHLQHVDLFHTAGENVVFPVVCAPVDAITHEARFVCDVATRHRAAAADGDNEDLR